MALAPSSPWPLVVAGGGAAGFMAAISAAEAGLKGVLLLEATPTPLAKVLISGGGRCNVTHACWDPRDLVGHYPRGGRALLGPFSRFATTEAVEWFKAHGLELVQEADGRLFPRSNRSSSVVATLREAALAAGVTLRTGASLQTAEPLESAGFALRLRSSEGARALHCRRLLLATGGHPSGRQIAASLGHAVVPPLPSLFTLALKPNPLQGLAGVVMDPVGLQLELPGERFRQQGPVLVTHWGLSGPATLRLTAFAARAMKEHGYRVQLRVDWSGGRRQQDLEAAFEDLRRDHARRQLGSSRPWPELSRRLWLHLLADGGIGASGRWAELRRPQQKALIEALRSSLYTVGGRGPFGEEFVTAGGVPLGEVNLATMASRKQSGLYFVGELLDVDGLTGGFNFQHCWTSGWLAGRAIAASADFVEDGEHR
ncbi:NAD(P)/FAD-dependent oxidoreductase [Cyanobium sp. Morenito 9A2]|uniref:NAD(P)/FAD-dependent oxidoreductase n=1 Tax=Cyanobium sp. Morenito 9A2 TaxID=2823718 RepID=UPI0020CCB264|nr:NAD(P)/FAD-dependent oxidoreductase [Cyanobium sp. Morenito 9A2]MCP9850301.1 NAD(P)/FAD-dependent oxidoreductase [Cyanobium sp. Morenito 9A2]